MNSVLDNSVVAMALLISAGYAVMKLGPRRLRQRLLATLSRLTGRAPAFFGLRRVARRIELAAAGKAQGACGGCESCGSELTPAQQAETQSAPPAEVQVPLGKIGRRANAGKRGAFNQQNRRSATTAEKHKEDPQ